MSSGVYIIAHPETGRCYVGSSIDVARRWKRHDYELRNNKHHSRKLQSVCSERLEYSLVEIAEKENLTEAEQRWMERLDSVKNGFNVCPTAGTPSTLPKTDEHKARIGAAHRGRKRSDDAKARMSAAMKGKKRTPTTAETAAKISAAKKGRPMAEETKARLSAAKTGVKTGPCSEARRLAISTAQRARHAQKKLEAHFAN
jgi:group I intron endonuclease